MVPKVKDSHARFLSFHAISFVWTTNTLLQILPEFGHLPKATLPILFPTYVKLINSHSNSILRASFGTRGETMFEGNPSQWTPDFFDKMRQTGDAYADKVIEDVFRNHDLETVNRLLESLTENDQPVSSELPPEVVEFFENTGALPEWTDPEKIDIGQKLFVEYSLIAFSALGTGSLPECYSGAIGARVLGITGQLEDHVDRRILETIIMVIDVMSPGGLEPEGKGIRASQKVRLMHAAIRYLILAQDSSLIATMPTLADLLGTLKWDQSIYGCPINQETKGFTYLTFTYVILRCMHELDIKVAPERQEGFFHCWNVIGHIMGIEQTFFVNSMADAEKLWKLLKRRLEAPSTDGKSLTQALMNYMSCQIKNTWIGKFLPYRHIPKWLTREMVGRKTYRVLGLTWTIWDRLWLQVTMFCMFLLGFFEKENYGGIAYDHRVAKWIFEGFSNAEHKRLGDRPAFVIPDHLRVDRQ